MLAACSTSYIDMRSPSDASDTPPQQADLPSFGVSNFAADAAWPVDDGLGSSSRAGFSLVLATSGPARPLYVYLDRRLFSVVPISAPCATEWGASYGRLPDGSFGTIPGGFPDGPHTLTLSGDDGQPVLDTQLDFIADAWNMLYVFGSPDAPSFNFVSDLLPANGSVSQVRIVNLLDTRESLVAWTCDASSPCQKLTQDLAHGDSWTGELSTEVSTVQFSRPSDLTSGALGVCQVQSGRREAFRHCVVLSSSQHFDGPAPL